MYKNTCFRKVMCWTMLICMGGACFQLSGCDQDIRSGILTGLNSATDTLLQTLTSALFTSLDQAGQSDELTDTLTGDTSGTGGTSP